MHEIFKKLSNRMVGAMMIHTQLTELFNFIDLEPDAKRQKKQLHEETDGLLKLEKEAPDEATRKKFEKLMMEMR